MTTQPQRPGGWVEGIGWVALLRDLAEGDEFAFDRDEKPGAVDAYWLANDGPAPVIVTRWADGTTPASSVTDEEATEEARFDEEERRGPIENALSLLLNAARVSPPLRDAVVAVEAELRRSWRALEER